MSRDEHLTDFLKVRMGVLGAAAAVICLGTIGLVDILATTSVDAVPLYVHITLGAVVFPVSVFLLEYRGEEVVDAAIVSAGAIVVALFFLLLFTEGAGRIVGGLFGLGSATVFYALSVSLISSTVIVMWLGRTRLDVLKPEKAGRRKEKDEGKRGKAGRRRRPSRRD
jgi:hypothetical protein